MNRFFVLVLLAVAVYAANPLLSLSKKSLKYNTWAVLVAGSNGYDNYRHQADVCHAYQVLHSLGVPEEHIIVMMEDDIAYNTKNPVPSKIFNSPAKYQGPDVYEGVPHDYTHELVNAEVFKKILTGEQMTVGSGKSLKSGPEDNVFVFYDDHGGTDILCFPHGSNIHSDEIRDIIDTMASKKMFKNLVFYIEACYSGSIFYNLQLPKNVYVTTAAPVAASSVSACEGLCDAYSYLWMHDLETYHAAGYSFSDQFSYICDSMNNSQSCQYGDEELGKLPIEDFFGPSFARRGANKKRESPFSESDLISNVEFELEMAKRMYKKNPTKENQMELNKQMAIRKAVDAMGLAIISAAKSGVSYLATPPCKTCDTTCPCMYDCKEDGKPHCEFVCCDSESCNKAAPDSKKRLSQRDSCVLTLANELTQACQRKHPYLLSLEHKFRRICKVSDINISSAVQEIRSQCTAFLAEDFDQ